MTALGINDAVQRISGHKDGGKRAAGKATLRELSVSRDLLS